MEKRAAWMLVAAGAGALGSVAVRQGLRRAWTLATHEDPPADAASMEVEWKHAIAWTVATSVVVGLGRLFARRGAAIGWQHMLGEDPPD